MKISNKDIDIFSLVMFVAASVYLMRYLYEKSQKSNLSETVETIMDDGVNW